MKILFVAQNPASEHNIENPLDGTKSGKVLEDWLDTMTAYLKEAHSITLCNASNKIGKVSMKDRNFQLMTITRHFDKIIALGNYSSKVLKSFGIEHFKLPHPSGLNRKLNDNEFIDQELKSCIHYLNKETLQ